MKLSIKFKLLASFTAIMVLTFGMSFLALQRVNYLAEEASSAGERSLSFSRTLLEVKIEAEAINYSLQDILLLSAEEKEKKSADIEEFILIIKNNERDALTQIETIKNEISNKDIAKLVEVLKNNLFAWHENISEIIDSIKNGLSNEDINILRGEGIGYLSELEEKIDMIEDRLAHEAIALNSEIIKSAYISKIVISAIFLLIGIFSIVIALNISLSLSRRINVMIDVTEKIAGGDLEQTIVIKGDDELDHLSEHFNIMAHKLEVFYESLEKKVKERTAMLSETNAVLEIEIDEHVRMKKALAMSESRFRQISDNAEEWIWEINTEGVCGYSNLTIEKVLGYEVSEISGVKKILELFCEEDRTDLKKYFLDKKPFRKIVAKAVHKTGKVVWLSSSGVPIMDEAGVLSG
ncbi:sensor signal transduction histidine kinase, partial [Candidatus Omnitrophus magneticus]